MTGPQTPGAIKVDIARKRKAAGLVAVRIGNDTYDCPADKTYLIAKLCQRLTQEHKASS